jgi:hypothetical protein
MSARKTKNPEPEMPQAAMPLDEDAPAAAGGILAIVHTNPALVLTDPKRFSEFYDAVAAEARSITVDLTTARGRGEIASMAHRVARTKTAIDEAGKKLNEAARAQINVVDEARRRIRTELDALRDEVRKPLDDWEAAEAQRVKECQEAVDWLTVAAVVRADEGAATVRDRLAALASYDEQDASWAEFRHRIAQAKAAAHESLTEALARLEREEADRVELARLRAEAEARAEAERIATAEAAQKEAARVAAEKTERDRVEAEKREAERLERERHAAAEAARREAERKAREEREAAEAAHAAEVARIRAEAEKAEKARAAEAARIAREEADRQAAAQKAHQAEVARLKAEADRLAAEEAARKAAAEKAAAEERARAADRAHRGAVMKAAKEALIEHAGLDEDGAKRVVMAITGGHVPSIFIRF